MDESAKRKIVWDDIRRKQLSAGKAASILSGSGKSSPMALLKFKSMLSNADAVIRIGAIDSLVDIGGTEAANIIQRSFADSSPQVRVKVCWAMGQLRHHTAATTLLDCLHDSVLMVVLEAAVALHNLGDKSGCTRIVHLMKIPGKHREQTMRALSRITQHKFSSGKQGIKDALRWIKAREKARFVS